MLYRLYNQVLETEFDLSLLGIKQYSCSDQSLNPNIRITRVKTDSFSTSYKNNQTSVSRTYGFYYRENIAFYEFISGKEIKVSPLTADFGADFVRILLNYPMACLLYQKGYYLLHASAVIFHGKVFIFPGRSLSGKSTIAAYLVKNGGKLITEDTAAIHITNGEAYISPSYPLIKLSDDANAYIGLSNLSGITFHHDKNARKGHFFESAFCVDKPLKVDFCIFPEWGYEKPSFTKPTFGKFLGKLLETSLAIYPLDKSKEKVLLSLNAKFLRSVDYYIYKREKVFSTLDFLKKDLEFVQRQKNGSNY